jgi:hypothetical protein
VTEADAHNAQPSNISIEAYLKGIDVADDQLASLRGTYMAACEGPKGIIKEIKAEVKEAGHSLKAFNRKLKDHRNERKRKRKLAAMEEEDALAYEAMRAHDYADTPLGAAAVDRHRPKGGDAALDSLRA